ncbi:unnamed protein product, partial [Mesorhabditis belari]|uniref:Uncharacterized protein n=1 Tax=Mesorhabditis belari TaxID=2138241 RepID=A0AAF3EJR8_9BILA
MTIDSKASVPFSNFSRKLQKVILKCLQIGDAMEMLKANTLLRQLILQHGPLPGKIDELRFACDLCESTEISLRVADTRLNFQFIECGNFDLSTKIIYKDPRRREELHSSSQSTSIFFKFLKTCASLHVAVDFWEKEGEKVKELRRIMHKYMSNLQWIRDLNVNFGDQQLAECFFEEFEAEIDFFSFDEYSFEYEKLNANFMNSSLLQKMPNIYVFIPNSSNIISHEMLKRSNAFYIHYSIASFEHFTRIMREFVENGIPSRNPFASMSIHFDDTTTAYLEIPISRIEEELLLMKEVHALNANEFTDQLEDFLREKGSQMREVCANFFQFCELLRKRRRISKESFVLLRRISNEIDQLIMATRIVEESNDGSDSRSSHIHLLIRNIESIDISGRIRDP